MLTGYAWAYGADGSQCLEAHRRTRVAAGVGNPSEDGDRCGAKHAAAALEGCQRSVGEVVTGVA